MCCKIRESVCERESWLDGMKALCIVGIVFIHTTFWSGTSYVPEWMRNVSLLLDVPAFFFITGAILGQSRVKPDFLLAQAFKLSMLFTAAVILIQIIFLEPNWENIFGALFLQQAGTPQFSVLQSSYWFVPIYIKSLFVAIVIIKFVPRMTLIYIFAGTLYILIHSMTNMKSGSFLGSSLRTVIFYSLFILLGYALYRKKDRRFWIIILVVACVISGIFWGVTPHFSMQKYKAPPTIIYGVYSLITISLFMLFRRPVKLRLVQWMGKNALALYMSQGISSTLVFGLVTNLRIGFWPLKLAVIFIVNLALSMLIGWCLSWYFARLASCRWVSWWRANPRS